jgi:4-alpha-glucanotransferase
MLPFGRLSGVLQPLFSFRSDADCGVGDFAALDPFFSWMQRAQQRMLMVLPLLPTTPGDPSPYSTRSAFGLNPLFLHLGWLEEGVTFSDAEKRHLDEARAATSIDYARVFPLKTAALERAFATFERQGATARRAAFERFCTEQAFWLPNYALYSALSESFGAKPWWAWPTALASRDLKALEAARQQHASRVRFHQWLQWVCDEQWRTVRTQAKAKQVLLCGDEPFIIGQDSADCWANQRFLRRDARLGVPPDDFSADGQDWGLPWFDFEAMERDGDTWLKARAKAAAATYDTRRIDHAIGYFRQYIRDEQAPRGRFVPADEPAQQHRGERNFRLLSEGTSIVAEDLGVIPRFARDTLARLALPGYQVMRWSREDGIYRDPRHYPEVSLVTTGTHDTESLRAWWEGAQAWERETACRTWPELWRFSPPPETFTAEVHEALLQASLNAQSDWCILPWSDVFGEPDRINTPGTVGPQNWSYRMKASVESLGTREDTVRAADWLARLTREARRS